MNLFELFDFMPAQGTDWAAQTDWLNNWITWASVFCTVAIVGVMLYFAIKYRRKEGEPAVAGSNVTHNTTLEVVWTVIPSLICVFVFVYGFVVYEEQRTPPANAMEVEVLAWKWKWQFTYPNGKKVADELTVPIGKPVRLIMTSKDVIHSFFLPSMRIKEDVYAGNYSYLWFTPTKLGKERVFCTEYCGQLHSQMLASINVVSQPEFEDFLVDRVEGGAAEEVILTPAESGKLAFGTNGCNACHNVTAEAKIGPGLKGLLSGDMVREFTDGTSLTADENYVRESILYSNKKVVKGYAPAMPSYEGQIPDEEITQLIAYIKSLK